MHTHTSTCRFCSAPLQHVFADLGMSPLSNSYIRPEQHNQMERFYPLRTYVCEQCLLVQLEEFESPDHIFSDYAYFSSYSDTWLQHAKAYTEQMTARFGLNSRSQVVELASNDGYLLQYFVAQGIPVLGVEPAANVAEVAVQKGIPSLVRFFGTETARAMVAEDIRPDLLLGNNVLAHVPNLNDFVAGMQIVLAPGGVITMEFPHLLRLMLENQFDTIYHEHFSYFSFTTVQRVFAHHGLTMFDVEELPTHGGSLRIYARHSSNKALPVGPRVADLLARESEAGLLDIATYRAFAEQVRETKRRLLEFLIEVKRAGKTVVGYGAPAKGNTLLNYCGIRTDFVDYTVDRSPHKQNHYLPGVHIPIAHPDKIAETKPDYLLILPWNLKHEIMEQMAHIRTWGGQFVVPIPSVEVLP
ncbi:MAG: class I SAM-dependent methyltransferase [Chloroflexaceae bacterium]|nr:class I SAM-dependent methyltransferase [Chloroflexaceae bacterium]